MATYNDVISEGKVCVEELVDEIIDRALCISQTISQPELAEIISDDVSSKLEVPIEIPIAEITPEPAEVISEEKLGEDEFVDKENSVSADVSDSRFIKTDIMPQTKRRNKTRQLGDEVIDLSVYVKRCGFITLRPISWLIAIEKYEKETQGIDCRWRYKMDNHNNFTECLIIFCFDTTKKAVLNFFLRTGVIMVQGPNYIDWATNTFPNLKPLVTGAQTKQDMVETTPNVNHEDNEKQLATEVTKGKSSNAEQDQDMESLWKKTEDLENALNNHDSQVQSIVQRCQNMELKITEGHVDPITPKDMLEAEKKFDEKLTVFMQTITSDIDLKLKNLKSYFNSRVSDIHSKIGELKATTQNHGSEIKGITENWQAVIEFNFDELKGELQGGLSINEENAKAEKLSQKRQIEEIQTKLKTLQDELKEFRNQPPRAAKIPLVQPSVRETPAEIDRGTPTNEDQQSTKKKRNLEILMIFDSNGKHVDRKKLWKVNGSEFIRCRDLFNTEKAISEFKGSSVKNILVSVGVNDLDEKDGDQVFGEMKILIDDIRSSFPGIRIIVNEITPRNDERDAEVKKFNRLLDEFQREEEDITVAIQSNLRDPSWSNFRDEKHVKANKLGIYCANIIKALKAAYNIKAKGELFTSEHQTKSTPHYENTFSRERALHQPYSSSNYFNNGQHHSQYSNITSHHGVDKNIHNSLRTLANYSPINNFEPILHSDYERNHKQNHVETYQNNFEILTKIEDIRKLLGK